MTGQTPIMSLLLDATLKTSLVILCALAAAALLRSRSAATRHWLLAVTIACAAAVPVVPSVAPAWQTHLGFLSSWASRLALPSSVTSVTDSVAVSGSSQRAGSVARSDSEVDRARVAAPSSLFTPAGAMRALGVIYVIGLAMNLGILLTGLGRLAWLAAHARRQTHGPWADMTRDIAREYGLRRPIVLLRSDHPSLVMTWGFLRPNVLLPASADDWSTQRMRVILGHELAHIQRGDWAIQIGAELLRCVYWFNPLWWITCRRLRFESERACDDAVLRAGIEGSLYATHVLELARVRGQHLRAPSPALAMASGSGLERRIRAMLNVGINRNPVTRSARLAIAIALSSLTLSVAGLTAASQASSTRFSGWIVDPSGVALPGAAVTIVDKQTSARQEMTTDTRGYFEYAGLPAGDYVIEVKAMGFAPRQDGFRLNPGEQTQRNFRLRIGSVSETVAVTATSGPYVPKIQTAPPSSGDASRNRARGQTLAAPTKIKDVRPFYAQQLKDAGVSGSVTLEGTIGTDGVLTKLEVVPPANPDLARAALDAVRQWRYEPTLLHGVPVETNISVSINFLPGS